MNYGLFFATLVLFYLYPTAFMAGFIIYDESSRRNPDYTIAWVSILWPFYFFVAFRAWWEVREW